MLMTVATLVVMAEDSRASAIDTKPDHKFLAGLKRDRPWAQTIDIVCSPYESIWVQV